MLIVVYAGANGAGKSTLFAELDKQYQLPFINPDMIAKTYFSHITNEEERYKKHAMPFAEELRKELLANNEDFSFETVLSHPSKIEFLNDAKEQGYAIYSIYIGTNDPSINVGRVANRVANGGHDVPTDKIVDRYYRAMENLPELLNVSEEAVVLDNSGDRPIEVFYKRQDNYYFLNDDNAPEWVSKYIVEPLMNKGYIREYPKLLEEEPSADSLASVVKNVAKKVISKDNMKLTINEWKAEISATRSNSSSNTSNGSSPHQGRKDDKSR